MRGTEHVEPEGTSGVLLAFLEDDVDDERRALLRQRLLRAGVSSEELEGMRRLWAMMGEAPHEQPDPALRARFYSMLEAYTPDRPSLYRRFDVWLAQWWPRRPVVQLALTVVLLCVFSLLGFAWGGRNATSGGAGIHALQHQVGDLQRLVALSLLQQPKATERLRGVSWSYQVAQPDDELLEALLQTLTYDANTNVRLASIDALQSFTNRKIVRDGLVAALKEQDAPIVQMALIDLIVKIDAQQARTVLWQMVQDDELPDEVRAYAQDGVEAL